MPRKAGSRVKNYEVEPSTNATGPKPVEPFSPWQLLIEKIREEKEITIRDLGARARIPAGTLFNWVRSKKGIPSLSAYTANLNARLAGVLGITPEELAAAYNDSTPKPLDPAAIEPEPAPRASGDLPPRTEGLTLLLNTLRSTGRSNFSLLEIETIAGMFMPAVKPLDEDPGARP